ncbi:MAG TPA: hypothetical protein VKA15_02085 [Isosphaeraceae bacterium]|nr:hypothetical protein [Isosphaeraceae bacterium]
MSFSQTDITGVNPPVQYGTELLLSWTSTAAAGTVFQVYLNQQHVWSGVGLKCSIPLPGALSRIDIGTVGPGEAQINFGSSLPFAPAREVTLQWLGGTYEAADLAGFHVYGEPTPGGGIDFTTILSTIPAYTAGIITDGFGYGGYGQGGYGAAAGSYSWTSGPLSSGTWNWAVKPFDTAGNEGSAQMTAVAITAPPLPPALFSDMSRLHYVYTNTTNQTTLSWNASP